MKYKMDDIQEEMKEFMEELAAEHELDYKKVFEFSVKNYVLDLDYETNQRSIRWTIEHDTKLKESLK